jgi:Xaa-Pro dipeptidase
MTQRRVERQYFRGVRALGVQGGAMAIFGKYTAFPHGSIQPQQLREGDFVLIDDGCSVEGYQSTSRAPRDFRQAHRAPDARSGTWSARRRMPRWPPPMPGATCESVDAAARKVITDAGIRSRLQSARPAAPHRPRHRARRSRMDLPGEGQQDALQPGMCFSDEPTIAIYGEFGVRLEDCMYITESGARMFTKQSPAIDQPFG